jgi:hypothetical protein
MEGSTSIDMPSQNKLSQFDIDEMSHRLSCLFPHEIKRQPEIREFDKDEIWEATREIPGFTLQYGSDQEFKKTVFGKMAQQGDIQILNGKVRVTDQGANRPECPGIYKTVSHYMNKSYLDEWREKRKTSA